ncbi:LOW QUALITY PROTEIN: phosphatidylserine lipase ABHD16A-like [Phaenicophaeus curvirostris]|uniref:LOW QUALITY PROTEIN: phosphatidylserine lipase ABHD16A-like n=1 Tax=Phaenicophaeus curvirostris TaxID=33595 RepID=UPI0037F0C721
MALLLSCVLGPRLYRVYRARGAGGARGERGDAAWDSYYQPRALEKHTDSVLALASVLWSLSYYVSPLAVFYLYRKGLLTLSRVVPLSHCAGTVALLLAGVACLRGLGRWTNPQYVEFISVLEQSHRLGTPESKRKLNRYSFDFRSWPVDFRWDSDGPAWGGSRSVPLLRARPEPPRPWWERLLGAPGRLGSGRSLNPPTPPPSPRLVLARTLGRRLLFPGSVRLLQRALLPTLLQGQARLVEEFEGQRAKLLACDGNEIDTMFIDRRGGSDPRGGTWSGGGLWGWEGGFCGAGGVFMGLGGGFVICCEGNAGFYEVGCLCTPLEAGYSVLGWNHPGFFGSTGVPLPQSEANAMDVVLRFALQRLNFPPRRIVLYAWSIGGFTATWAAMSYPELGALVLDASFDDVLPLALKVLPRSWRNLVTQTVREHLNLNNGEQLCRYQGPVLLVRRTKDEIITTTTPDDIGSNCGNELLMRLLRHRYPKVMAGEGATIVRECWRREWLEAAPAEQGALWGDLWGSDPHVWGAGAVAARCPVDERWCRETLGAFSGDRDPPFPWGLGEALDSAQRQQLALFLAQHHLQDFEASHCSPLPPQVFRPPRPLGPSPAH